MTSGKIRPKQREMEKALCLQCPAWEKRCSAAGGTGAKQRDTAQGLAILPLMMASLQARGSPCTVVQSHCSQLPKDHKKENQINESEMAIVSESVVDFEDSRIF